MAELNEDRRRVSGGRVGDLRHPAKGTRRTQAGEGPRGGNGAYRAAVSQPMALFSEPEMGDFRSQWGKLQIGFVDEPRRTVEGADKLVAAVMQRLADGFANERSVITRICGENPSGFQETRITA